MKKLLVVLMLVVFAIPTLANPFSDVPFSHWAYDAVSKLSTKGLITGFPDGSFKGQRTMTRYELAMVVARLLAKVEGKNMGRGDMAVIERLTTEFADELALLGVKVTALEDEVAVVKDDIAMIKDHMSYGHGTNNGKIRFSGKIEMRAEMNEYKKSSTSGIYSPQQLTEAGIAPAAADNFNGIIGSRGATQTNENATNFRTKVWLFMDANIDEHIDLHVHLRNRLNSTSYDVWGTPAHSVDDEWATDVYEAYVQIKDFFGWADVIKFGRQYYGVAQGLMFPSEFKNNASISNMESNGNSYGYDGVTAYKRFNDTTSMDIYGLRTDTDENTGLNVLGLTLNFEIEKNLNLKVYYAARNDQNIFDPADAASYTDVPGIGAALAATQALTANYAANYNNLTEVQYYGLAVNGDITRDIIYYAEFSVMDHMDTVLDPEDTVNWIDSISPQKAFMIGLKWQAQNDLAFTFEFRSYDEYYRSILAGNGLYNNGMYDTDNLGDTEYENLGYTSDFRDMFIKVDYALSSKTDIVLTYEAIDDTTSLPGNNGQDDDMSIWTIGFAYKYKANTTFKLYWKQFDVETVSAGATGTALPIRFVDNNANGVYNMGVDNLNLHDRAQEDHSQLRCELTVKF